VLSAAIVALELAAEEVGASLSDEQISKLLQTWTAMLLSGRQERDPAIDAFERLLGMLARGQRRGMDEHGLEVPLFVFSDETKDMTRNSRLRWETIHLHNQPIAYKKEGEDYWRIPTQTPQFRDSVGTHVMQQFGQLWGAKGLIRLSGKAQSATGKVRIPVGGTQPCVLLPETQM
jgi:hypothetical protein